jgi:hypothetical protein
VKIDLDYLAAAFALAYGILILYDLLLDWRRKGA